MSDCSRCYVCDEPLLEVNSSKEHIILNACGGMLKSYKLLCKVCNNKLGTEADAELAKQLSAFSTLLNVERDRDENQPIHKVKNLKGEEFTLLPGAVSKPIFAKPIIERSVKNETVSYKLAASNVKTMRQLLGIVKKEFPNVNINEAEKHFKVEEEYLTESLIIEQTIGGELAFRSITKTAISFFIHSSGDSRYIKHILPYIGGTQTMDIVRFSLLEEMPYLLNKEQVFHLLYVKADSISRRVYVYIDFFNTYSYFVNLSDNYEGPDFENIYCYDLISKSEQEIALNVQLLDAHVKDVFSEGHPSPDKLQVISKRINRTMRLIDNIQIENQIEIFIGESMMIASKELGEPETYSEEFGRIFHREFEKRFLPFYANLLKSSLPS